MTSSTSMTNMTMQCTCCTKRINAKRVGPFFYNGPHTYLLEPIFEECSECKKFLGHLEIKEGNQCFDCKKEKAELEIENHISCTQLTPRAIKHSCVVCGENSGFDKVGLPNIVCKNITCVKKYNDSKSMYELTTLQNSSIKNVGVAS